MVDFVYYNFLTIHDLKDEGFYSTQGKTMLPSLNIYLISFYLPERRELPWRLLEKLRQVDPLSIILQLSPKHKQGISEVI